MRKNYLSLHELAYAILSLIYLGVILLSNYRAVYIAVVLLGLLNLLVFGRLNLKRLLLTLLCLIPVAASMYITSILFISGAKAQYTAVNLSIRISAIAISSVMFTAAIDAKGLIVYLMRRCKLPIVTGYALLAALNALKLLNSEFKRIQNAYLMRYGKRRFSLNLMLPLLVSAARYSLYDSINMESMGLNSSKTFVHSFVRWQLKDSLIVLANVIALAMLYCLLNKQ